MLMWEVVGRRGLVLEDDILDGWAVLIFGGVSWRYGCCEVSERKGLVYCVWLCGLCLYLLDNALCVLQRGLGV